MPLLPGVFKRCRSGFGRVKPQPLRSYGVQYFCPNFRLLLLPAAFLFTSVYTFSQAPAAQWANRVGGSGTDLSMSIAVDASGNVFYAGVFSGTVDFNPGAGIFNLTSTSGSWDMYLSKLDNSGNFLWAKSFVGTHVFGLDWISTVNADVNGDIYITGAIAGTTDFDPGPAVYNLNVSGSNDVFVVKLDNDGNLIWAKLMNGTWTSLGNDLIIEPGTGNIYTCGSFEISVDFDPGPGTSFLTVSGGEDAFICKLDAAGNFIWARKFGGAWHDQSKAIALDASGNLYSTGYFESTADFDPGPGVSNLTSSGLNDIFIVKLTSTGNFIWAGKIGGTGIDFSSSLVTDAIGNVYVNGTFNGTVDFDPGPGVFNLTSSGTDAFICKLNSSGNFVWAIQAGGPGDDLSLSMTADAAGNIFTTGLFTGTVDFNPGAGVFNLTAVGNSDVFICKLSSSGNLIWAKSAGGTGYDAGNSMTIDATDHIYLTGTFRSPLFPFDIFSLTNNSPAAPDVFIAKLDTSTLVALPVELVSFSAQAIDYHRVEAKWTTLSEMNNDYFVVQKSEDGFSFEDCARVDGAGNSTEPVHYSFVDRNPFLVPVSYYRLQQVDYDGTRTYYDKVAVKMHVPVFELLEASGNESIQIIRIEIALQSDEPLYYRLYDISGKLLIHNTESFPKGINTIEIPAESFTKGIYYFTISNGHVMKKVRVVYY